MNKPKISVIIPVYNTEDYLEETLISLLNQTIIEDIEVIMVDDESTDDSRYIVEKYALDYDNFHAYHKANGGQGIARNFGLDFAKGEYISFYDSDDYLPPNGYETLYNKAKANNNDIIIGNVIKFARYNEWDDFLYENAFKEFTGDIGSFTLNERRSLVWDALVTNKLYRRDFLTKNNIQFIDKKIFFEDILFAIESFILADSIGYSHEIFHHWRLRGNQTSTIQQDKSIINFKSRLEVLGLSEDLMVKYDCDEKLFESMYMKWINHDLKFFLKRFNYYPEENQMELFTQTRKIVNLIPDDLIDGLNTYKKVLFKMIKNNDYDNFIKFAPLENELCENPHVPEFLNDEYKSYMDFDKAVEDENLTTRISEVSHSEDTLCLDFEGKINYLTGNDFNVSAKLVDIDDNEHDLEVKSNRIIIPFDLISTNNHSKVKIIYKFADFEKIAYLKNNHRKSIVFEDFDIDLNLGVKSYLVLDYRNKSDNEIEITDVSFDVSEFTFWGTSKNRISQIYIENILDFNRVYYPVEYAEDSKIFTFKIPYDDILNAAVKKWEINCDDSLNSIAMAKRTLFFTGCYRIKFVNSRNKILIENDLINTTETLYEFNDETDKLKSDISALKSKNNKLNKDNNSLKSNNKKLNAEKENLIKENQKLQKQIYNLNKKNENLNNKIEEYKSRKVVKIADKLKRF